MNHHISRSVQSVAFFLLTTFLMGSLSSACQAKPKPDPQKIMLALLLDTSNSMDGLIEQAKSQLWTVVNELSAAKCNDGSRPEIKIALFEYGNDGLPQSEGYMRMVTPLTGDLDEISQKLFALTTNGGEEYCGYAIDRSIKKLNWSESKADLKIIFIAGNEPFSQGHVSYQTACGLAKEKDIVVNTIFCGDYDEGIRTSWKSGAILTGGSYMSIEQNRKTVYVQTPHDDKIDRLNNELNKTYIYYGTKGKAKKEMQMTQDQNAGSYGQGNKVQRAVSKSSNAYKNASWDLVDAYSDDAEVLETVEEEHLPAPMQSMNSEQKKAYVEELTQKREAIKKEIQQLNAQRKQYIAENTPVEDATHSLDKAMVQAIKEAGKKKQLIFE